MVEVTGSRETRRPDVVLFVNGIPLVVIECKRPDMEKPLEQAISQMIRNQGQDHIPHLFAYAQLLLAAQPNAVQYATTGTKADYWAVWQEETDHDAEIAAIINRPLTDAEKDALYNWRDEGWQGRRHFDQLGARLPTAQDRALWALLCPARLLELAYQYIVYDNGTKKVARYQQYFAIRATVARVSGITPDGSRSGGVIWHTTVSGKSLTMVMLAKALALHPSFINPRVIIVTDRVDLDGQIAGTFKACGA